LTALTIGRLALVPVIAISFMASPLLTVAALLLFMVADLYDGILARRLGGDGPRRRAVDSIVDRVAIDACLVAAAVAGAMPIALVCAFLLRDLYCAVICVRMMRERSVAIKTDLLYRGLSCLFAGWAMAAPFLSAEGRLYSALALLVASLVVAGDLTRAVGLVRRAPATVRGRVIPAAALRRSQADWGAASRPSPVRGAMDVGYPTPAALS
jgi:phosphatidylglycerophosphate synthase